MNKTLSFKKELAVGAVAAMLAIFALQAPLAMADGVTYTNTNTTTSQGQIPDSLINQLSLLIVTLADVIEDLEDGDMMTPAEQADSEAADLRVSLNKTLQEHVDLALPALRNAYDDADDYDASLDALDENSVELAAVIGSVYGDDAEDDFLELWRDHIGFFADYTVGLATDDEDMQEEARDDLEDYHTSVATFLSDANPNIDEDDVMNGAMEHGNLLLESMDAYDNEDYDEAYELQREAGDQVQGLADIIALGVLMQYPSQF
tara:strand:- start:1276 stop:2061 length:786 start_codon:yes stop_codon:yes gene_type:complete